MTNEIAQRNNLPASVQGMAAALAASVAAAGAGGSELYMKMTKTGSFVYGAEETEVEEGSTWAANPLSFQHGFVAWGDEKHGTEGKNVGEVLVPATTPMPLESSLPEVKGSWSKCIAFQVQCMDGEDAGTACLFKSNSHGGRKAYAALVTAVMRRIGEGNADYVPIVNLVSDSYKHEKYGKIFTPEFQIVGWMDMDGVAKEEAAPAAAPAAEEKTQEEPPAEEAPRRRRRRA